MTVLIQRNRCKREQLLLVMLLCLIVPMSAATKSGFVTKIYNPNEFDVGALRVLVSQQAHCETETLEYNVELESTTSSLILAQHKFVLQQHTISSSAIFKSCDSLSLNVGSRVDLIGNTHSHRRGLFIANNVTVRGH